MQDGQETVGTDEAGYVEAGQLLVAERLTAPRLKVLAKGRLLVEREGVPLGDAARQRLPVDFDALAWDLKADHDLAARLVLGGRLGADADDSITDGMMGAGWDRLALTL